MTLLEYMSCTEQNSQNSLGLRCIMINILTILYTHHTCMCLIITEIIIAHLRKSEVIARENDQISHYTLKCIPLNQRVLPTSRQCGRLYFKVIHNIAKQHKRRLEVDRQTEITVQ